MIYLLIYSLFALLTYIFFESSLRARGETWEQLADGKKVSLGVVYFTLLLVTLLWPITWVFVLTGKAKK